MSHNQEQVTQAEVALLQAIGTLRNTCRGTRVPLADAINELGMLYLSGKRYDESERLLSEASSIYGEELGEEHPYYATSLNNLGLLCQATRADSTEAEGLFRRAITIHNGASGGDTEGAANVMNNLAALLVRQERGSEADELYRRAVETYKSKNAENVPCAMVLCNWALLYSVMGRIDDARRLFDDAVSICRKVAHPKDPRVMGIVMQYSGFLVEHGQSRRELVSLASFWRGVAKRMRSWLTGLIAWLSSIARGDWPPTDRST